MSDVGWSALDDTGRHRHREASSELALGERFLIVLLGLVVVVAVVPYGATGDIAMPFALLCAAIWCVPALLLGHRTGWPTISRVALGTAAGLGTYMVLQMSTTLRLLPVSPLFGEAGALLSRTLPASASIAPGRTAEAIAPILVPLTLFAVACRLLRTDRSAVAVLGFLSWFGGAVALFGLLQHLLAPELVLLAVRTSYLDDLTAVFVNRNTAATFLGGSALLSLGMISHELGRRRRGERASLRQGLGEVEWKLLGHGLSGAASLAALLMTSSRAGTAATLVAVTLLIALLFRRENAGRRRRRRSLIRFLGRWAFGFLIGAGVAVLAGAQTLDRALTQGTEDGRFCVLPGIWNLALMAWPWGTGAGTFELAFRPVRDPACGIHGTWDRAHSFYLEGLVVLGAPFLIAVSVALVVLATILRRGWARRRRFRAGPALGGAFLLLLVLHDLVDFSIQIPGIAIWAAVALAACCALCERKQPSPQVSARLE